LYFSFPVLIKADSLFKLTSCIHFYYTYLLSVGGVEIEEKQGEVIEESFYEINISTKDNPHTNFVKGICDFLLEKLYQTEFSPHFIWCAGVPSVVFGKELL